MTSAHWLIAMKVWLILLLLIPKSDAEVSCTAGAFPQNSKASVICNFNQDLNVTRQNFNVVQHVSKDATDSGNYVLLCNWGTTELECNTKDGYSFNKRAVSTRVTLDIPRMSESQKGVYVCQIVPGTSSVTPNTCELSIGESRTTTTTTTTQPTAVPRPTLRASAAVPNPTPLPGGSGTSENARNENNNSGSGQVNVALVICLVIFILLFLTTVGIIIYLRKSFRFVRKAYYCSCLPCCENLEVFQHDEEVTLRRPSQTVHVLPQTPTAATESRNQHSAAGVLSGSQLGTLTNPTSTIVTDDRDDAEKKHQEDGGASDSHSEKNGAAQSSEQSKPFIVDYVPSSSSEDEFEDA